MNLRAANIDTYLKFSRQLFYLVLIISCVDFFTDPISRTYTIDFEAGNPIIKIATTIIIFLAYVFGIRSFPRMTKLWIPFWIVFTVIFFGMIRGLFTNNPYNTLNDTLSYSALFLILVIINFNVTKREMEIDKILIILVIIMLVKVIAYELLSMISIGSLSWKIMVKQSAMLLIPFSVYLSNLLNNKKKKIYFFITTFLLIIAMARMIFISLIFISVIQFVRLGRVKSIFNILWIFILVASAFYLYLNIQSVDQASIFEHVYGGEVYEKGIDYRTDQLEVIIDRYVKHPFLGVGMGYYTPGYLTYGDLSKPYLLELDLLNFFSKIGLLLSVFYIVSYFFLYRLILDIKSKETRELFISIFIGLIATLVYSTGQTAHQSYLYWISYSVFYGYLILEIKGQNSTFAHGIENLPIRSVV